MIPYGRQHVTQADIDAVTAVLKSDYLTQGPAVVRLEEAVASRVGSAHGIAVQNATSALHIACLALGLGPGDLLWTSPNTFVASANCALYCGADVDFIDIDAATGNMSVSALREKLHDAKRAGRLPKILIPVHFAGQPTCQDEIAELRREYGFRIIEDASHAIGASRDGEPVGSCRWSDITIFSFHPVKIITTGEGGMALTNDADVAMRLRAFRSHGITRQPCQFTRLESNVPDATKNDPPAWYYEQQVLGYNFRLTDIQAALGLSQLDRLEEYVGRRNELARRYDRGLSGLPLHLPVVDSRNTSAFHLYVVRLDIGASPLTHRRLFDFLRERGVGVSLHYPPVHLQPYYVRLGFAADSFPVAETHGKTALTLPLYAALTDEVQDEVIAEIRRAFGVA